MEPLTSTRSRKWSWIPHLALGILLLCGPQVVSGIISLLSNVITWPISHQWSVAFGGYETFNTDLLLIYVIGAVGTNLILQAGAISLGQSALMAVGAYLSAIVATHFGVPFGIRILMAALACAVVGYILGLPSLRLGAFTLAIITAGYALVVGDLIQNWRSVTGGGDGLANVPAPKGFSGYGGMYWMIALFVVLSYLFAHNYLRSPIGRESRVVHDSPIGARALGISVRYVKLRAFMVGSAIGGVAGALYGSTLGFISPDEFSLDLAILLLIMCIFGGQGTLVGPIVGAVLLFRIPIAVQDVSSQPGEVSLVIYGAVLLLSVYVVPKGLMSIWWNLRGRLRTRSASGSGHADTTKSVTAGQSFQFKIGDIPASSTKSLSCAGISKRLGGNQILKDIDIEVSPGSVHALIGPNGSGKTTLLNVLCGYMRPDAGMIRFGSEEIGGIPAHLRSRLGLGRTFQLPIVFEAMSCLENVMAALDRAKVTSAWRYIVRLPSARRQERATMERAFTLLGAVGLSDRADAAASLLSPGERRLLEIVRIAAMAPAVILMDEPGAGLSRTDIGALVHAIRSLREQGIAVLLVEHHMDIVAEVSDEVTVLDFGDVIARGSPEQVLADPRVRTAYLGLEPDSPVTSPGSQTAKSPPAGERTRAEEPSVLDAGENQ